MHAWLVALLQTLGLGGSATATAAPFDDDRPNVVLVPERSFAVRMPERTFAVQVPERVFRVVVPERS